MMRGPEDIQVIPDALDWNTVQIKIERDMYLRFFKDVQAVVSILPVLASALQPIGADGVLSSDRVEPNDEDREAVAAIAETVARTADSMARTHGEAVWNVLRQCSKSLRENDQDYVQVKSAVAQAKAEEARLRKQPEQEEAQ